MEQKLELVNDELKKLRKEIELLRAAVLAKKSGENFLLEKKEELKTRIREFMLKNCNISMLDDKIEEKMYNFILDEFWNLTIGRLV